MASLYFPHDFTASRDSKIIELRKETGWEGYGLYWALLEMLGSDSDHELPTKYNHLAWELRTDAGLLKKVVEDFGLFTLADDGSSFYSERLSRQLEEMDVIRKKRQDAANKRWKNANAQDEECKCIANAQETECIKKEKKKNKNINSADAELRAREEAAAAADLIVDSSEIFSPQTLVLCDEIAAKFNVIDGRVYARQVDSLLRAVNRPGVVDGATVIRDALKRLDTAKAIQSGKVKITITRFLREDIFLRLINGDYDDMYSKSSKKQTPDIGVSFEAKGDDYYS